MTKICQLTLPILWGITGILYPFLLSNAHITCFPPFLLDKNEVFIALPDFNPDAGFDQQLCNTTTAQLFGTSTGGIGLWSTESGAIVHPITGEVQNMVPGNCYTFTWTVTDGVDSETDEVEVCIDEQPAISAGTDQQTCNSTVLLSGNIPTLGTGTWSEISGLGANIHKPSLNTTLVSNLEEGNIYEFVWTITNGTCSTQDIVAIIVDENLLEVDAGSDQELCNVNTTILNGTTNLGTGAWSTTGTATVDPITGNVSGMVVGDCYTFQWFVVDGTCTATDEVEVCVFDPVPTFAGPDQNICSNTTSLSANTPVLGIGEWSIVSGGANITIEAPNSPSTTISNLQGGLSYELAWTVSNGACQAQDIINIVVDANPLEIDAGSDQLLCSVNTTTLIGSNNSGFGVWTTLSSATINPITGEAFGMTPGSCYTFTWTVVDGTCVGEDEVEVCIDEPTFAFAGADQQACAPSTQLSGIVPPIGVGEWSQVNGLPATITDSLNPTSTVVDLMGNNLYEFVWTATNGSCIDRDTVVLDIDVNGIVADAGPDQVICDSNTTMLNGSTNLGVGAWFSNNIGVTVNPISGLVSGMEVNNCYDFVWNVTDGSCIASDTVEVCVYEQPFAAVGGDIPICATSTTLTADIPTVGTGQWFITPSEGVVITDSFSPSTTVSNLQDETEYEIVWMVTNGGCIASDTLHIAVDFELVIIEIQENTSICDTDTTTLEATHNIGAGLWHTDSDAIVNPVTGEVSGMLPGNCYNFEWTVNFGACSQTSDVEVCVDIFETAEPAGNDQLICINSTQMEAQIPTLGTGLWTVLNGGNAVFADPTNPTTIVTDLEHGQYEMLWTVSNGSCNSADTILVDVVLLESNAGVDQTVCTSSTQLAALPPIQGTGQWVLISSPGALFDPNSPTTSVDLLQNNTLYEFVWTVTDMGCVARDTVQILVDFDLLTLNAGADQNICGVTTTTLNGTQSSGTGLWSTTSNATIDPNTGEVSNMESGTCYTFTYTVTDNLCTLTDEVEVCVESMPIADTGLDQNICNTETTLNALQPNIGTGTWTLVNGNATIAEPNNPNSTLTNLMDGNTYELIWTVTNGFCTEADTVQILVDFDLLTFDAGADQNICGVTTTTLNGTQSSGTGLWSTTSNTTIDPNTGQTSNLTAGNCYTFTYTVTDNLCTLTDEVEVCVESMPIADAGLDQNICSTETSLNALQPNIGTGTWTLVNGNATIAEPNNPNTNLSNLEEGSTYQIIWTVTNGFCTEADTVQILVDFDLLTLDAGADQNICGVATTTLNGTQSSGTGLWSTISNATIDPNTGEVSNMESGTCYTFTYTVTDNLCTLTDEVEVCVESMPIADAGLDQNICNTETTLNALQPNIGTGTWTLVNGNATIAEPNNPNSTLTNLMDGNTYELIWTVTNGFCTEADTVQILVDFDLLTLNAGADQNICGVATTTLNGTQSSGTGLWSTTSNATIDPNTGEVSNMESGNCYTFTYTVTDNLCSLTDEVEVCVESMPIADAGLDQNICSTETTLNALQPNIGTGTWTLVNGNATIAEPNNPNTNLSNLEEGSTYQIVWTVTNGFCTEADTVQILVDFDLLTLDAGADQNICGVATTTLNGTQSSGTGLWSTTSNATIDPNTGEVSNMESGNCYTFTYTVTDNLCTLTDEVEVCVESMPIADAGLDQNICSTETTLNALQPNIGTGTWTLVNGNATIAEPNNPNTNLSNLEEGSTYQIVWTVTNGFCTEADTVQILVDFDLLTLNAGADQNICGVATTTLNGTQSSGTGLWSTISNATIDPNTGEVSNMESGNCYTFTYTVTDNLCTLTDEVEVCVESMPIADAGLDQNICSTETTLNALQPNIGTGTWTLVNGNATIAEPNNPNTNLSNLEEGSTYQIIWTVTNGFCTEADTVQILVDFDLLTLDAGADQNICGVATTTLNGTQSSGTGLWSTISNATIDPNTGEVSNMESGNCYTFTYTVTDNLCTLMDEVEVCVESMPIADAGLDQNICSTETSLNALQPNIGTGTWTLVNGNATIAEPNNPNTNLSNLEEGSTYQIIWTVTNGFCTEADTVQILVDFDLLTLNAGADQNICGVATTTLNGTQSSGTGLWSTTSNATIDPNTGEVSNMESGNCYTFTYTVTDNLCTLTDEVEVCVESMPIADAGLDQNICTSITELEANLPDIGEGMWHLTKGSNLLFNPFDPITQVTGFIGGESYEMTWVVTNGFCQVSSSVSIAVDTPITLVDAGEDQRLCAVNEVALNADYSGGIGTWTSNSDVFIEQVHNPNTSVGDLEAGNCYTFVWSVIEGSCQGSDEVEICIDEIPLVDAGMDQQICANTTQLEAEPSVSVGYWELIGGDDLPNSAILFQEEKHNTFVSGLEGGKVYEFVWTVTNGVCNSQDTVVIEVGTPALLIDAGVDQFLCGVTEVTLTGIDNTGTGTWSTQGAATVNAVTGQVSGLAIGCQSFIWTVNDGICEAIDEVEVCVGTQPNADAGGVQAVCASSGTLNAQLLDGFEGHWMFIGGSGFPNPNVTFDSSDPNTLVAGFEGNKDYEFVWTVSNEMCADSDTVRIEVGPLPLVVYAGDDLRLCGESEVQLLPIMNSSTAIGYWSTQSTATIDPITGYVSNMVASNCYEFLLLATEGGCVAGSEIEVCVDAIPTAFAGIDQEICTTTTTLFANEPPANGMGFWTVLVGEELVLNEHDPVTSVSNLQAGETYSLSWTVTNGACEASDTVSISVASEVELGVIQEYVYWDENQNGVQDEGEVGIEGVSISLYDTQGLVINNQTTDENGLFRFEGIMSGDYFLVAPTVLSDGSILLNPSSIPLTVNSCQEVLAKGFGYISEECPTSETSICAEPMVPITVCPDFCLEADYMIEIVHTNYDCSIEITDDNCVVYTALPLFIGEEILEVIACSVLDSTVCDTAYIYISVGVGDCTTTNEAPIAVDDFENTPINTPIVIDVIDNDIDPNGDELAIIAFTTPNNGTVELVDGQIVYTPNTDFIGTDSFVYQICDMHDLCDEATVTITICSDSIFLCTEPLTPLVICPQFCDLDMEEIEITTVHTTYDCSLLIDGNCVQYTALPLFVGLETIEIVGCNPSGVCDTTYVVVQVTDCQEGDGSIEEVITDIETLEERKGKELVIHALYPVPTADVLKVDFDAMAGELILEIYDLTGRLMAQKQFYPLQSFRQLLEVNVADFAAGTYLLHLKNEWGTSVERFVKY